MALPQIYRLLQNKDFETVFKSGRTKKNGRLLTKVRNNGLARNRFGFVISAKVSKRAVVRNKIRRMLSETVRARAKFCQGPPGQEGKDIVAVVLKNGEKLSLPELKKSWETLLKDITHSL